MVHDLKPHSALFSLANLDYGSIVWQITISVVAALNKSPQHFPNYCLLAEVCGIRQLLPLNTVSLTKVSLHQTGANDS